MNEHYSALLKRKADLICVLILCEKISNETIEGERKLLKIWCQKFLPDKMNLYEMIYESRFNRLIAQFRSIE